VSETDRPFFLAVASHKGGTGRSTTAAALAWTWGRAGRRVRLVDADPVGAATLIARGPDGSCGWANVAVDALAPGDLDPTRLMRGAEGSDAELVIVDCPALSEPAAMAVLSACDGALLTCLADPLSLRTAPSATAALAAARKTRPDLRLMGLLICQYRADDPLQSAMMTRLREGHARVVLEPPVPFQPELADWAMSGGADLPPGTAATAYEDIAIALERSLQPAAAAV
jgi:cellulose biosynthesis protein BcsQ